MIVYGFHPGYERKGILPVEYVFRRIRRGLQQQWEFVYLVGDRIKLSDRYQVFMQSPVCVSCGLVGTHFAKERSARRAPDPQYEGWHLNLYGLTSIGLEVMTTSFRGPRAGAISSIITRRCVNRVTYEKGTRMRVIICGGREYSDLAAVRERMRKLPIRATVVHGAARGADSLAHQVATEYGFRCEAYPADWDTHGNSAGAIRNQQMLARGADLVIAFPGGNGTAHMKRIAAAAGVPVEECA